MATIAENLQTIKDSTSAIKQAILEKGGVIEGNLTTYATAITNLPSGGDANPTAQPNDVAFYDYDGTIRYSYTKDEFLALTEMPPLPTQKGLICQEWNWSYEDAMEYVGKYGRLNVGATYITDDGKTRLYISITDRTVRDVALYFGQSVSEGVLIDWGDGSDAESISGAGDAKKVSHVYADVGDYCITMEVVSGYITLGYGSSAANMFGSIGLANRATFNRLKRIEIGQNVKSILNYAFSACISVDSITIPNSVTSLGIYSLGTNYGNKVVVIPNGITSIPLVCYTNTSAQTIVLPSTVTAISANSFQSNVTMSSIIIPEGVTAILQSAFSACSALSSMIIPSTVTKIAGQSAFANCSSVKYYDFSHHEAVPTLENANAFTGINPNCKIIVPDALYDEWTTATNWSTYANYIISKTDWDNL